MTLNASQLATFDQIKETFVKYYGNFGGVSQLSACCAGLIAAIFTMPFDNVKTRVQNMKPNESGILP